MVSLSDLTDICEDNGFGRPNRRTIISDIRELTESEYPIEVEEIGQTNYYYNSGHQTPSELRVLVDAVEAAQFITKKDSLVLMEKLVKPNLSKRNFKEAIVPYLLRNMNIFMPNQVWAIDITYIHMNHSHMYLTVVIDWYSRKVVGWNLSDSLETSEAIAALENAIEKHGVPGIVNSNQGSTFTSKEFKDVLKKHGIRQSMDGKSRWADNVIIERWFRSLKSEKIYPEEFYSPRHLRTEIKKYIEEYNSIRPHQAHEYNTPDDVYQDIFENEIKPDTVQAA